VRLRDEARLMAAAGIENILKIGQADKMEGRVNQYAQFVEECKGVDNLEKIQQHESQKVIQKAQHIMLTYFDM
jgi:hypothetical protein